MGKLCQARLDRLRERDLTSYLQNNISSHPCPLFLPCKVTNDLPNFPHLTSCNIGIFDPPPPLKHSDVFYGWPLRKFKGYYFNFLRINLISRSDLN